MADIDSSIPGVDVGLVKDAAAKLGSLKEIVAAQVNDLRIEVIQRVDEKLATMGMVSPFGEVNETNARAWVEDVLGQLDHALNEARLALRGLGRGRNAAHFLRKKAPIDERLCLCQCLMEELTGVFIRRLLPPTGGRSLVASARFRMQDGSSGSSVNGSALALRDLHQQHTVLEPLSAPPPKATKSNKKTKESSVPKLPPIGTLSLQDQEALDAERARITAGYRALNAAKKEMKKEYKLKAEAQASSSGGATRS